MVFFFYKYNSIKNDINNNNDSNMVTNGCSVETRCYRTDEIVKYVKNIGSGDYGISVTQTHLMICFSAVLNYAFTTITQANHLPLYQDEWAFCFVIIACNCV